MKVKAVGVPQGCNLGPLVYLLFYHQNFQEFKILNVLK